MLSHWKHCRKATPPPPRSVNVDKKWRQKVSQHPDTRTPRHPCTRDVTAVLPWCEVWGCRGVGLAVKLRRKVASAGINAGGHGPKDRRAARLGLVKNGAFGAGSRAGGGSNLGLPERRAGSSRGVFPEMFPCPPLPDTPKLDCARSERSGVQFPESDKAIHQRANAESAPQWNQQLTGAHFRGVRRSQCVRRRPMYKFLYRSRDDGDRTNLLTTGLECDIL